MLCKHCGQGKRAHIGVAQGCPGGYGTLFTPASSVTSEAKCELCGQPMPKGEEMFKYHGYSCSCPEPPVRSQGDSEEAAFRKAMATPAEVWYPCGCKASAGAPKHCPEHHYSVCGKNTIEYVQGVKHSDGSELCHPKGAENMTDWDWWFSKSASEQLEFIRIMRKGSVAG